MVLNPSDFRVVVYTIRFQTTYSFPFHQIVIFSVSSTKTHAQIKWIDYGVHFDYAKWINKMEMIKKYFISVLLRISAYEFVLCYLVSSFSIQQLSLDFWLWLANLMSECLYSFSASPFDLLHMHTKTMTNLAQLLFCIDRTRQN